MRISYFESSRVSHTNNPYGEPSGMNPFRPVRSTVRPCATNQESLCGWSEISEPRYAYFVGSLVFPVRCCSFAPSDSILRVKLSSAIFLGACDWAFLEMPLSPAKLHTASRQRA